MNIDQLADGALYSVALDAIRARSVVMLGREIKAADSTEFYCAEDGEAPPSDHVCVSSRKRRLWIWRDPTRPELRVQLAPVLSALVAVPQVTEIAAPASTPVEAAIVGSSKTLRNLNWS